MPPQLRREQGSRASEATRTVEWRPADIIGFRVTTRVVRGLRLPFPSLSANPQNLHPSKRGPHAPTEAVLLAFAH